MASVTVIFGGQEQRTFELDKPRMVVGREPSCEIHIDNLGISRQHCAFEVRGEAFLVQDLGSSNGTYVNGRKVTELYLNNEDEVVIGKYTLKFKNTNQTAAAVINKDSTAPVPDTLNTYVMDGQKIQEQLAKMRQAATSGATPAAGSPAASGTKGPGALPTAGATAKDYAKAFDATTQPPADSGKLKGVIIALVVVIVVIIGVLVAVLMKKS